MFGLKRRRRPQAPVVAVQSLESRALMSATARIDNGVLRVEGTSGNDRIIIKNYADRTQVLAGNGVFFDQPTSKFQSIDVKLKGGSDSLSLRHGRAQFNSIRVDTGSGASASLHLETAYIGTLSIVAMNTNSVDAVVMNSTVNTLNAEFGDGNDELKLEGTTVNDCRTVTMGGGQDLFHLVGRSTVNGGKISMGAGNDEVSSAYNSRIHAFVVGGAGYDTIKGTAVARHDQFENFKIRWA